jgi:quercetin dioxygenase-like cupin family protein
VVPLAEVHVVSKEVMTMIVRKKLFSIVAALGAGALLTTFAFAQNPPTPKEKDPHEPGVKGGVLYVKADEARFTEVVPGVQRSILRGDADGLNMSFIRIAPGHKGQEKTAVSDEKLLVLDGVYILKTEAGETRLLPKTWVFIPKGLKFTCAGDEKEGALLYVEAEGRAELKVLPPVMKE